MDDLMFTACMCDYTWLKITGNYLPSTIETRKRRLISTNRDTGLARQAKKSQEVEVKSFLSAQISILTQRKIQNHVSGNIQQDVSKRCIIDAHLISPPSPPFLL